MMGTRFLKIYLVGIGQKILGTTDINKQNMSFAGLYSIDMLLSDKYISGDIFNVRLGTGTIFVCFRSRYSIISFKGIGFDSSFEKYVYEIQVPVSTDNKWFNCTFF